MNAADPITTEIIEEHRNRWGSISVYPVLPVVNELGATGMVRRESVRSYSTSIPSGVKTGNPSHGRDSRSCATAASRL